MNYRRRYNSLLLKKYKNDNQVDQFISDLLIRITELEDENKALKREIVDIKASCFDNNMPSFVSD